MGGICPSIILLINAYLTWMIDKFFPQNYIKLRITLGVITFGFFLYVTFCLSAYVNALTEKHIAEIKVVPKRQSYSAWKYSDEAAEETAQEIKR